MKRHLSISEHVWQLKKPFIISRGARTQTSTLCVSIECDGQVGCGEAVASPRYGETNQAIVREIEQLRAEIKNGLTREELNAILPAGSTRNALDNALWDLDAKLSGSNVGALTGLGWPKRIQTVQTVSILSPDEMREEARLLKDFPIIKVKLDEKRVIERIRAVHAGAPNAKIMVDANESWTLDLLQTAAPEMAASNVIMIEQPLPAEHDTKLTEYTGPLPIFADESCHTTADLDELKGRYKGINIKLDKSGGLTEGLKMKAKADALGLETMVGCMLGTSLGMAPALFLATHATYVDVDAPALLAEDWDNGLSINNGQVSNLNPKLWGG